MTTRYADDATLARLAELEAENAALALDAARYRWFRTRTLWDADVFPFPEGFQFNDAVIFNEGAMLDAAIDAAMGATP